MIRLIDLFNKEDNIVYNFFKNAFIDFLSIIYKLDENISFFQLSYFPKKRNTIIHQINSIIRREITFKKYIYTGSILSVDDIILNIFRNLQKYFFISFIPSDVNSFIWPN